jgi:cell division protein FtsA
LQTPLVEAERIKTLYGTLLNAQSDEHESFSYPIAGEEDDASYETTKARLTDIVRPRVQQLMGLVRERLALNAASRYAGDKVVLTGGASQLLGLSEFVANELGRSVRLGRPSELAGLNASLAGPQLATLSGLAIAVARGNGELSAPHGRKVLKQGYLGRVGTWLKRGF